MRAMFVGKPALGKFGLFGAVLAFVWAASLPLSAQTPQPAAPPSGTTPATTSVTHRAHHKKSAAKAAVEPAPIVPVAPPAPLNMFEQPAVPATVTARKNVLTVKADNSSLTQILHQVSTATGMQLDGLGSDERVFGSFGPGAPREVLTALLNGTSYNIVMVGDLPNGAPRQLMLTRRDGSAPKTPAANPQHAAGDDDSSDDTGASDDPDEPPPAPPPMQNLPPGQPIPQGVRTPQNWQQLQQMRNLPTSAPPQ